MHYQNIREEELKNKIATDYFQQFDCTKIIGNIDFCVTLKTKDVPHFESVAHLPEINELESLLWAEAKKGKSDIYKSIVQLILTIGKARTFDKQLPPAFLGAFDAEKIAFVAYNDIHELFYTNDFNWNVTPSNYETKEFNLVLNKISSIIDSNSLIFHFGNDDKDLLSFIKSNFVLGKSDTSKIRIDKSNFMIIYNKWLSVVKPTIAVNWDVAKRIGIIDGDFYLADLLSLDNESLKDKLYVFLRKDHYELDRKIDEMGMFSSRTTAFNDSQKAHNQFWNKYERPPREEYWDYIVERRDLLVPQDVRERKGSFFTPQIWVELSQKYLADVLGTDWQDEYYVWDCAAGTGNLLTGLTNKYNVWASTLDTQDVEVMKDRIRNGANLLEDHVFQFDFLNDDFEKLPKPLYEIINNPEKRKKLVVYINPPYAEHGSNAIGNVKLGVNISKIHDKYHSHLAGANRELFAQFLIRVYIEIPNCFIGEFSTLKSLMGSHFTEFRINFKAKLTKMFVMPADTFDNVNGQFPIGFKIWNTFENEIFKEIYADVYDAAGNYLIRKGFYSYEGYKYYSVWVNLIKIKSGFGMGWLQGVTRNDFQTQNGIEIRNNKEQYQYPRGIHIYAENLIQSSICFAVRKCINATWLNDRDQFLYPNDGWKEDTEFQNDCLAFTLFHGQNRISSKEGTNHWIPFTEYEVGSREKFDSNFMTDFIKGKMAAKDMPHFESVAHLNEKELFEKDGLHLEGGVHLKAKVFSPEATAVFNAGRELWRYYHSVISSPSTLGRAGVGSVNASLYDIREYYQGRNTAGKMNNKSDDAKYMELIGDLRDKLKLLAKKIEPKVYEYGFLKG